MKSSSWSLNIAILFLLQVIISDSRNEDNETRQELVVETLVLADDTVIRRFDSPLRTRQYVMEMIRLTNILLADRELPYKIRLKVLQINWLNSDTDGFIHNGSHLTTTVQRFCSLTYQRFYSAYHYDHAVLFTQRIHRHATGVSLYGKMCRHPLSCSIIEDTGFTFVFNLAHEIMHSLGVDHDGETNSCLEQSGHGNIMAPTVRSTWTKYRWSQCTRDALAQNISQFECILPGSTSPYNSQSIRVPARTWTKTDQCRILLGLPESFTFFINADNCPQACDKMWCPTYRASYKCVSYKNTAPPPGSPCGLNSICSQGRCVNKAVTPLWSNCSLCTGSGVQVRANLCQGGQACSGQGLIQIRSCPANNAHCDSRTLDIRERVCRSRLGPRAEAFHFKSAPCTSVCGYGGKLSVVGVVPNGSPCHFNNSSDVCLAGRCWPYDCLGRAGGTAGPDGCGVCLGNGSSCSRVSLHLHLNDSFTSSRSLHTFPRGAKDILISKTSPYLSLGIFDGASREFVRLIHGNRQIAKISNGLKLSGRFLPNGFALIYGHGTLLSSSIELKMRWRRRRPASASVYISYTRTSVLNKIQPLPRTRFEGR